MYHIKVLATYEKSLGQDLLSQELCSIAYWELFDAKEEGFMRIDKMVDFLRVLLCLNPRSLNSTWNPNCRVSRASFHSQEICSKVQRISKK
jgi:hypothetical protein